MKNRRSRKSEDGARPKKYGKKVTFKNVFKEMADAFQTATLILYGKEETVKYICMDLIWKPIGRKLRFVLVKTNGKSMILACSDLCMHPERIIAAYSYRFKIEVSFKMLKHVIGGFCYHFWTAAMPKLSRFKTWVDLSEVTEKLWRNIHKVSDYATLSNIMKYQKTEDRIPYRPSA